MRVCICVAAVIALAALLCGCGGGGGSDTGRAGTLTLTVDWPEPSRLIPLACNSIKAVVTRQGGAPVSQVLTRPANGKQTSVSFTGLAPGDVTLTATAYPEANATGVAQATGSAPATIVSAQTSSVTVTMASTIDHVAISPTNPLIHPADEVELTFTAYNASDEVVLVSPSKVIWFTPHTSILTLLQSNGTAITCRGAAVGEATVSATETESGKAASAKVSVQNISLTSPWPGFGHDPQHTGVGTAYGADGVQKWLNGSGTYMTSSPAIAADGTVYICMGYANGMLSALKPGDGSNQWTFQLTNSHNPNSVTPAVGTDGTVYCAGNKGTAYAVNPADGTQRWATDVGPNFLSSPTLMADGTVLIGSSVTVPDQVSAGKLVALNPTTGAVAWEFPTTGPISDPPAIGPDGTIYVRSDRQVDKYDFRWDGTLWAIDPVTHLKKWDFALGRGDYGGGAPSVGADGTVYIGGGNDARLYAVNPLDGTQKWEFITAGAVRSTPAIRSNGTVYFTCFDGKVYAVNGQSGQKVWDYQTQGTNVALTSSPAIDGDGVVYFVTRDGKLTALSGGSGTFLWEVAGASHESSPAIGSDGTVYVGGNQKAVLAVK